MPSPISLHRGFEADWATPGGWRQLMAVNHTALGLRFAVTGFVFFLIGGLLAMLMRAQLATSGNAFLDHDLYNQIFTMHGTVMMFLFAIPILEGLSFYLLPKLLGARDLIYPRLTAFGYWCYLFGGMILIGGLVLGVAPDGGWFMYTPLTGKTYTPGISADVWLIGVTFVEISALCAGVELAATVLKVRTAGMTLARMPLFGWYILVTALMILAGFPPLILGSILLEVERAFGWPFFEVERGGDPLLWQHLFWMFGHPEVYILFLPAAGIVSTLLPVFARRPIVGYSWIVASVIATGFISFALWVHHMFAVGISHLAMVFFSAASMLVAIPTGVQFFAWIATLWAGRPVVRLPMLYLFGFLVVFVAGGLTGVMLALIPFDWQVHDTHFVVAHLHYVLVGGLVFPLLAGAYYWMPLISGRMPSESLGKWAFWLIFIGFNLTFFLMHLTGLLGMPRRVYTYSGEHGWDWLNLISSIGGFVLSAGFAVFILDAFLHFRLGRRAGRNPWGAHTLDWAMAKPPPNYNFASQPEVAERDPLITRPNLPAEIAAGKHYLGTPRPGYRETLAVGVMTGKPSHIIELPGPTWIPLWAGLALAVFFVAFLLQVYWLSAFGIVAALGVFLRWAWLSGGRSNPKPVPIGHGLRLMPHMAAAGAPGWWGMVFSLFSNGVFLACLLFGYVFLWTMAPGWPAPEWIDRSPFLPLAAAVTLTLGAVGAQGATKANAVAPDGARSGWLVLAILAGAISAVLLLTIAMTALPPPRSHAYAAITTMLTGYAALHAALGGVFAAHAALRIRKGFVSRVRSLDLRVVRLWWFYTAATGLLILAFLYLLPLGAIESVSHHK